MDYHPLDFSVWRGLGRTTSSADTKGQQWMTCCCSWQLPFHTIDSQNQGSIPQNSNASHWEPRLHLTPETWTDLLFENFRKAYYVTPCKAERVKVRKRRSRMLKQPNHRQPKIEQIFLCLLCQRGKINLMESVIKHFFSIVVLPSLLSSCSVLHCDGS